jgi:hypothetical protein
MGLSSIIDGSCGVLVELAPIFAIEASAILATLIHVYLS